ncbi:hypothetical protein HHI36_001182 [Cryptolaemus montrouzieri]|uniref:Uncharacterized protein n=1 Tax=Cryptolaemus montrouzieri TaxID=559131 RepID=A0ABD2P885_9CUCU
MSNLKMKRAKAYRNTAITEIQLLLDFAKRAESDINQYNIFKARFSDIERIRDEFDHQNTTIVDLILQDENGDITLEDTLREGFLADYYCVKAIYDTITSEISKSDTVPNSSSSSSKLHANMRLPKLELKRFEGDCTQFPTFIGLFNALVHNNASLSKDEKFHYLVSSLPPLTSLESNSTL